MLPVVNRFMAVPLNLTMLALLVALMPGAKCFSGPVNASPGLRWWLFSNFGASKICPELNKSGLPLKLGDGGPTVGRFFPTTCTVDVRGETQTVTVNFSGRGYAFTAVTKRISFDASASVEYRPDFYLGEEDVYVWGKVNRVVAGPNFQVRSVENAIAGAAAGALGNLSSTFGNQIVTGELTRGFTVLQNWDTDTKTFAMGIINPPAKPRTPYNVSEDEALTLANETIEVNYGQRDYIGPFEVVDDDQAIGMRMFNQGPAVDVMVVSKMVGDQWRNAYIEGNVNAQPPGPVVAGGPLQPNMESRPVYTVPPGAYYIVVDNTSSAGSVSPPATNLLNPIGGPAARISFAAQLIER